MQSCKNLKSRLFDLFTKRLIALVIVSTLMVNLFSISVFAQNVVEQAPVAGEEVVMETSGSQPAMQNVFFNTLWGALTGGLIYMSLGVLDDSKDKDDRFSQSDMGGRFLIGATYGSLIGLGFGIAASYSNVGFDPERSRISTNHYKEFLEQEKSIWADSSESKKESLVFYVPAFQYYF